MDGSDKALWAVAACSEAVVRAMLCCTDVLLSEGRDAAALGEARAVLDALSAFERRTWAAVGGGADDAVDRD